jgi:hypothetical protein
MAFLACAAAAQTPLRYRLQAGDRLVYERRAQVTALDSGKPQARIVDQIQFWCLEVRDNRALVLLDRIRIVAGRAEPIRGALFYMDESGVRRIPESVRTRAADLDSAFEVVPVLRPALKPGRSWTTPPDRHGRRRRCTRGDADPNSNNTVPMDFEMEDPTGVAEILGRTMTGRFWFDPGAGRVTRVRTQATDRAAGTRTEAAIVLRRRGKKPQPWLTGRVAESRRYLNTLRGEDRLLDRLLTHPRELERILDDLDRLWASFLVDTAAAAPSPFRLLGKAHRARLLAGRGNLIARANFAASELGARVAHWSLQTPGGETLTSEALRDRTVVECFWSADSVASLRSFGGLRELQEHFGERIRVVCVNIDADIERARRAASRCGPGLTHLLAGAPLDGRPPRELPILRILRPDSTVARVLFGLHPSLIATVAPHAP